MTMNQLAYVFWLQFLVFVQFRLPTKIFWYSLVSRPHSAFNMACNTGKDLEYHRKAREKLIVCRQIVMQ